MLFSNNFLPILLIVPICPVIKGFITEATKEGSDTMKIENSNVMMRSEHSSYTHTESASMSVIMRSDEAATLEFSEESKSFVEQMKERQQEQKRQAKEQVQEQNKKNIYHFLTLQINKVLYLPKL